MDLEESAGRPGFLLEEQRVTEVEEGHRFFLFLDAFGFWHIFPEIFLMFLG